MTFNSIEEAIAHIKQAIASGMPVCADEIKRIMDETTNEQVTGFTGQIFNSVEPTSTNDSAEAEFKDNGKWYSLVTGEEVGNPIKFLEAGTTWGRDASNIMETSSNRVEQEVTEKLKEYLRSQGIPVE